jgi:hypothetical protein
MNIDERDSAENQSSGDTKLISLISIQDEKVSSGLTLVIGLGDGKCTKSLFDFLSAFPSIIIEAFPHGFQIIGILKNKDGQGTDMVAYMTFKSNKIAEYFFFPKNYNKYTGKECTSLKIELTTSQINNALKKGKATTIMRFELIINDNINSTKMNLSITNGLATIPYILETRFVEEEIPLLMSPQLANLNIEPNFKMTAELLSSAMGTAALKYGNHAYDFTITIYNSGISIYTKAPDVGGIKYGKTNDQGFEFLLDNSTSKHLCKIHKITPRGTILITALDNTSFKLTMPIGSCGDGYIFKFPKLSNNIIPYQTMQTLQYSNPIYQQSQYYQQPQIPYNQLSSI